MWRSTSGTGGNDWENDPKKREMLKYFLSSACSRCYDGKKKVFSLSSSLFLSFLSIYLFLSPFRNKGQVKEGRKGKESKEHVKAVEVRDPFPPLHPPFSHVHHLFFRFKISSRFLLFGVFMVSSPSLPICFGS